jgi:hypothetical protein
MSWRAGFFSRGSAQFLSLFFFNLTEFSTESEMAARVFIGRFNYIDKRRQSPARCPALIEIKIYVSAPTTPLKMLDTGKTLLRLINEINCYAVARSLLGRVKLNKKPEPGQFLSEECRVQGPMGR